MLRARSVVQGLFFPYESGILRLCGNRRSARMSGMLGLLKSLINGVLGFAGVRLVRNNSAPSNLSSFPSDDPGLRQMLTHLGISVVFDVGAHVGQYATRLRNIGYRGRIISFEPQAAAVAVLSEKA